MKFNFLLAEGIIICNNNDDVCVGLLISYLFYDPSDFRITSDSYSITFCILRFNLELLMYQIYLLNVLVSFVLYLIFSKFPAVGHPLGLATVCFFE